jgi:CheY-like chemotaxis protein
VIVRELQRSGYEYEVTWEQVQTAPALAAAIEQQWDVITCDWVMPAFSGPAALKLLAEYGADLPLIIVSGQAAEEVTVTAMNAGAHDVVSKQNLTRLGPAVERELRGLPAFACGLGV